MDESYVLEWLDTLITVTLNPEKTKISTVGSQDVTKIQDQLISQKYRIQSAIKSAVFSLNEEAKIKCLIKKYHSSLIALLDQALEDQATIPNVRLKQVLDIIISSIDDLLHLIEHRFNVYLSIEAPIPATYLAILKKELDKELSIVSKKLQDIPSFQPVFTALIQELKSFLNKLDKDHSYTFREIFYIRELCGELERLEPSDESGIYTSLDKLLIRMNFNSSLFITDMIERVKTRVDDFEPADKKMERLLFYQKSLRQLHRRPDVIFKSKDAGVYQQIDNWFSQEVFYLERQRYFPISSPKTATPDSNAKKEKIQKIVANLSVDQIALILKAADDLRIIVAHSLSSVFKSIVPHLSTPKQKDISYNSMRGKAYSAESRDKEIVIEILKQMIQKVSEY